MIQATWSTSNKFSLSNKNKCVVNPMVQSFRMGVDPWDRWLSCEVPVLWSTGMDRQVGSTRCFQFFARELMSAWALGEDSHMLSPLPLRLPMQPHLFSLHLLYVSVSTQTHHHHLFSLHLSSKFQFNPTPSPSLSLSISTSFSPSFSQLEPLYYHGETS